MITVTLDTLMPNLSVATAQIRNRPESCGGRSKLAALGYLVQAFPETFLLGSRQRSMRAEDLGKIVFRSPRAFGITIRDTSK